MLKRLLLFVIFMLMTMCIPEAYSKDSLPLSSIQQSANLVDSTTSSSTASKPLQGGVQKVELGLEKLRDVGLDLKYALKAASNLHDEVSFQPVRIITQPEMIGAGTIINVPIGTEPTGPPQPARKERVDAAISSMKPIINMLKKNADEFTNGEKQLDLSDSVMTKLQPQFQEWVSQVNNIAEQERELEQVTQSPPYNNEVIAKLTISMQKNLKDLDKVRQAIYKVIRKEGNRVSSTKS